jgi:hypothetical protein
MGRIGEVMVKAVGLVEAAKKRAQDELPQAEYEEIGFSLDLGAEFQEDPAAFLGKYEEYLTDLTPAERAVIRGGPVI